MEETSNRKKRRRLNGGGEENDEAEEDEECGLEVWETLSRSFRQVQTVLDQNRILIQQVNENHQSKIPDNLARNVALICQINGNISKALSIYSDLSVNFSSIIQRLRSGSTVQLNRTNCSSDGNKMERRESVKQSIQQ